MASKYQDFMWETTFKPSDEQIAEEQANRGYHPAGYGEPFGIKITPLTYGFVDGKVHYMVSWKCWGSCD